MKYWIEKRTGSHTYYVVLRNGVSGVEGYGHGMWWYMHGSWTSYVRRYLTLRGAERCLKRLVPLKETVMEINEK